MLPVEHFPLDLAGFQHILSQRLEHRFFAQWKSQCFHMPDQSALPVADSRERLKELPLVPDQVRPICQFVDAGHNHRSLCGKYTHHSPRSAMIFHRTKYGECGR
ncbi:hypothetical protein SPHV1_410037 [Novosphingobium sp. KN65.2]|nr:hypothetical protein SPHV1_410037 [Novosphingobium sp. KN65.2]